MTDVEWTLPEIPLLVGSTIAACARDVDCTLILDDDGDLWRVAIFTASGVVTADANSEDINAQAIWLAGVLAMATRGDDIREAAEHWQPPAEEWLPIRIDGRKG